MIQNSKTQNWIVRGGWAIADQGLFAFANVLLNILLARWLTPAEYGAFAVAYSLFLFLGTFHTALITEPLLVFGAGKYKTQLTNYLKTLIRGHWVLTAFGSVLLAIAAMALRLNNTDTVSQALFGLSLAAPFSLLMWLGRRTAYLRSQPNLAAFGSAVYAMLIIAGLFLLAGVQTLSVFSAMLVVGASGAIAGSGLWIKAARSTNEVGTNVDSRTIVADHLRYGRWACATSMLMWVPLNLFFVVLSVLVNLEASATLRALSNLVLPLLQANAALGTLLLPALVARTSDRQQFMKLMKFALALFASGAIAYSLFVGTLSGPLIHLLYGGRYDNHVAILSLLLLIPICDGLMMVLSSALRAFEKPACIFWSQLVVAAFVLTIGILAAINFGLWGAAASIVIANVIGLILLGINLLGHLNALAGSAGVPACPRGSSHLAKTKPQAGTPALPAPGTT